MKRNLVALGYMISFPFLIFAGIIRGLALYMAIPVVLAVGVVLPLRLLFVYLFNA